MAIDNALLGKTVAGLRQQRGLTQREVSEQTGLTINYLSLVENGERVPSFETLEKLANVFDVPAEFITFLASKNPGGAKWKSLAEKTKGLIWSVVKAS